MKQALTPTIQSAARLALASVAAMAALGYSGQAAAQVNAPTEAVTNADGVVYGYKDLSNCVIWAAPSKFPIGSDMTHDRQVLHPGAGGISTFVFVDVANSYARGLTIAGKT